MTSFAHIIFIANAAFLRLPKLAQWTIISLAKSVIASALMSAVTLYATGFFAIRHGFRVPIEGVPYLSFAVGIATFATFALTMLLFGLILFLVDQINSYVQDVEVRIVQYSVILKDVIEAIKMRGNTVTQIAKLSGKLASAYLKFASSEFLFVLFFAILSHFSWVFRHAGSVYFGLILYLLSIMLVFNADYAAIFAERISSVDSLALSRIAIAGVGVSILVVCLWCAFTKASWISAQIYASILIFITMAAFMFVDDVYGSFLRIVRLGGGIYSTVEYANKRNEAGGQQQVTGNLLLVTHDKFFMFNGNKHIVEIPGADVISIAYDVDPEWGLPDYIINRQRKFLDIKLFPKDTYEPEK